MTVSEQLINISHPTCHDVLSGRGNIANRHAGNEHFRSLVKKYKTDYVACAKSSKPLYSKLIYDEIRSMSPPGRFLKQDPTTKLWNDIGKKAALAKTRQALREGAPELLMDIQTAEHVRQTLVQDFSQATTFTNSPSTATLSDYLPRSESNASFTSGNLLSLVPTNNSKFQFSGSVVHTQGSDCLHVEPPSLDSNITSSHHDVGRQFQPVNQSIDWQQLPIVPTMSSCNMPSVSQTVQRKHEHNMNADVAFNQQTCNASSNALMALIDSMKSSNETIDQNVSQSSQTMASPALGTLLQQLQSQIACQQLLTQLGLSQSA